MVNDFRDESVCEKERDGRESISARELCALLSLVYAVCDECFALSWLLAWQPRGDTLSKGADVIPRTPDDGDDGDDGDDAEDVDNAAQRYVLCIRSSSSNETVDSEYCRKKSKSQLIEILRGNRRKNEQERRRQSCYSGSLTIVTRV